jgi:hypothetical protein
MPLHPTKLHTTSTPTSHSGVAHLSQQTTHFRTLKHTAISLTNIHSAHTSQSHQRTHFILPFRVISTAPTHRTLLQIVGISAIRFQIQTHLIWQRIPLIIRFHTQIKHKRVRKTQIRITLLRITSPLTRLLLLSLHTQTLLHLLLTQLPHLLHNHTRIMLTMAVHILHTLLHT